MIAFQIALLHLATGVFLLHNADPTAPVDVGVRDLVAGNNAFAFDLYEQLASKEGNLFIAPQSVSIALGMTYAGAHGDTADQMAAVMHFPSERDQLNRAFAALLAQLGTESGDAAQQLNIVNALWGQRGYGFLDEFLAQTRLSYGAGFREVDFRRASEQARDEINRWVAGQTQQKIQELLQAGDVDAATALVLTNAVYFKGAWAKQFDRGDTRSEPFHFGHLRELNVPLMHQLGQFAFASEPDVDILELPFDGGGLAMVVVLPKDIDGLSSLEAGLCPEALNRWVGSLRRQPVRVTIPRFTVATRVDLADELAGMGMPDAFGAEADFSGMTTAHKLFISNVFHEARMEANEEGAEATAATAVVMTKGPQPAAFLADHPFVFVIRDRLSGSILFMGRVVDPSA